MNIRKRIDELKKIIADLEEKHKPIDIELLKELYKLKLQEVERTEKDNKRTENTLKL